ncbi:hypothetical protein C7M84_014989 [Penaeus vannamei]|uniref:Fibronectin type-III domain-containing protein n=1 Tax=Penaeus vannamei TaxID=6689 RepID=A0A423SRY2_PENVA|nr:hypothetical protein C7M84_014989 [Penaeus vannamei]
MSTSLYLRVTRADSADGPEIEVTWTMPKQYPHLTLTWVALTYTSQVSEREVGNHQLEEGSGNYVIKGGLRYNQQYKICLITSSPACDHASSTCSYVKVPSAPSPKNAKECLVFFSLTTVFRKLPLIFSANSPLDLPLGIQRCEPMKSSLNTS